MPLKPTEKVHIVERRLFNEDMRRHFIGEVVECTEFAVRIKGFAWVFDSVRGLFQRRAERRERVYFLGDRLTINVLPASADVSAAEYEIQPEKGLHVTDHKTFSLEVTEFSTLR